MKVSDIVDRLGWRTCGICWIGTEVAVVTWLISWLCMAGAESGGCMTLQTHTNIVAVACFGAFAIVVARR